MSSRPRTILPMGHVEWHGDAAMARVRHAAAGGVTKWAEYVLTASRAVVPLEEGTLERSGRAHPANAADLTAHVSYDTVYAARQHEELTWRHAPGRQAKYLEGPMNASGPAGLALVGAEIRKALT